MRANRAASRDEAAPRHNIAWRRRLVGLTRVQASRASDRF
jgi:hypothetical protein